MTDNDNKDPFENRRGDDEWNRKEDEFKSVKKPEVKDNRDRLSFVNPAKNLASRYRKPRVIPFGNNKKEPVLTAYDVFNRPTHQNKDKSAEVNSIN